jgi:hypothetical protein
MVTFIDILFIVFNRLCMYYVLCGMSPAVCEFYYLYHLENRFEYLLIHIGRGKIQDIVLLVLNVLRYALIFRSPPSWA